MPVILALRDHRVFRKPDRERDRTKKKTPSPRGTAHNEKKRKRARERTGREFALFPPRASAKRRKTSRLNVNRINTVVFNKCRFACKLGASCLLFVSRIGNASYPSCSATRSYVDLHFRGAARAETPPSAPPRRLERVALADRIRGSFATICFSRRFLELDRGNARSRDRHEISLMRGRERRKKA